RGYDNHQIWEARRRRDAGGRCPSAVSRRPAQLCCSADADSARRGHRARPYAASRSRFMTGWLLDTNVLSAFVPGKPVVSPTAAAWFDERTDELFLSAIT